MAAPVAGREVGSRDEFMAVLYGIRPTPATTPCWNEQYATFHGYRPLVPDGERIDWIRTSARVRIRYAAINIFAQDGQFPSDHFPVQAVLEP